MANSGQLKASICDLTVLSPLVLSTNLIFLLGGEVVCDIECLSNFLGTFALDHIRHGLATHVKKRFDVQVVGCLHKVS